MLGGTPVVRDTRISVYALLGRVEGGDLIEEILADYPGLTIDAFNAAIDYARKHPLAEKPGGRPWRV